MTGTGFVSGASILIGGTAGDGRDLRQLDESAGANAGEAAGGYTVQVRNPNGQTAIHAGGFTYSGSSTTPTARR